MLLSVQTSVFGGKRALVCKMLITCKIYHALLSTGVSK